MRAYLKRANAERDRRVKDYEETRAKNMGRIPDGAYTCPGRSKLKKR